MAGINRAVRIGTAAVALGFSLSGTAVGLASADSDESAGGSSPVSAGPEKPGNSARQHRGARPAAARRTPTAAAARRARATNPTTPVATGPRGRPEDSTKIGSATVSAPAPPAPVAQPMMQTPNPPDDPLAVRNPSPVRAAAAAAVTGTTAPVGRALLADARIWLDTFANLYPWWSGSLLPERLRQRVFHSSPVAPPIQVELDLGDGVTSRAIPFSAYDPDGNALLYSVPGKGSAGGPSRGTVVVDNTNGTFTYTPDEYFTGTDTFSFVATDSTTLHLHAWKNLLNAAFGLLGTSLAGGHRVTATVTVFNNVDIRPDPAVARYTDIVGDFSFLTYNVSGLPGLLSGAKLPRFLKTIEIGSRLGTFDAVNVQEDVGYHPFLLARAKFPDQTAPSAPTWLWPVGTPFSDGLNSFSGYYIESLSRQSWTTGSNPLNPRGFTYSRQHIPGGSSIDVYNLDAGGGTLTNAQIAQLSEFIEQNSLGRAVIVAGDFGQLYSDAEQMLTQFAAANGLTDAWVELEYGGITPIDAPTCAYADSCEQPDKIFYRNAAPLDPVSPASSPVVLRALSYTNEGLSFLDRRGQDLSAHRPQSVSFGYSVDAVGPMNVDLSNWMADLPALSALPLTQLPIPGSHDSGSYGITSRSAWALTGKDDFGILTELPEFLQNLLVKPIAAAWGRTQAGDLTDQFSDGIRYVDLRVSNEPDGQIYIEHGLRGPDIGVVIGDIAEFATAHPKEVLIVYVQGIKNFDAAAHAKLIGDMQAAFGTRMVPRSVGTSATLADLWSIDKNVIVVYNNSGVVAANPDLWPDATVYRPWPNYQSWQRLLGANETNLANRPAGSIWGMFGEPTPDTTSIVTGVLTIGPRSNKEFMWNVQAPLQQWIRVNFKQSVNLVTADWYQQFWPQGSTFARDGIGAVYETMASRVTTTGA